MVQIRTDSGIVAGVEDRDAIRFRAYARPPQKGESTSPVPTVVHVTRVNKMFMLGEDYLPRESRYSWSGSLELAVNGDERQSGRRAGRDLRVPSPACIPHTLSSATCRPRGFSPSPTGCFLTHHSGSSIGRCWPAAPHTRCVGWLWSNGMATHGWGPAWLACS